MKHESIARICHEVNRAHCQSIGDDSQVSFDEAPEWQRSSAIEGVVKALEGATPEQLHESWLEAKRRDGWQYGPIKDAEKRTHPCFVPYSELPQEQRAKDYLFSAVVLACAVLEATEEA